MSAFALLGDAPPIFAHVYCWLNGVSGRAEPCARGLRLTWEGQLRSEGKESQVGEMGNACDGLSSAKQRIWSGLILAQKGGMAR